MNNKGDFASIVFVVILIFVIAVVFFLINHLNREIFGEMELTVNETGKSDTESHTAAVEFIEFSESGVWDYAVLAIYIGCLIALALTAYGVRISPVFYWIYGILALIVLALGIILSNIWIGLSADPEFTTTLARFPITNFLLGTKAPVAFAIAITLFMVILFGKARGSEGYY